MKNWQPDRVLFWSETGTGQRLVLCFLIICDSLKFRFFYISLKFGESKFKKVFVVGVFQSTLNSI
jgi:hypothetical protein